MMHLRRCSLINGLKLILILAAQSPLLQADGTHGSTSHETYEDESARLIEKCGHESGSGYKSGCGHESGNKRI